jgi:hypothetical protein
MITPDQIERLKEGLDSHSTTYLNGDDGALDLQDACAAIDQWAKEENDRETLNGHLCRECAHTGKAQSQEPCNTCSVVDDKWEPKQ